MLKTGPILLRNILGPVFNLDLDQFLIWEFVICCVFVLAEITILECFQPNMQKF